MGDRYPQSIQNAAGVAANCYYSGISVHRSVQTAAEECSVDILELTEYLIACGFGRVADGGGA